VKLLAECDSKISRNEYGSHTFSGIEQAEISKGIKVICLIQMIRIPKLSKAQIFLS
jgi:hypothetical protein